jgi:hypothetical protein
MPLGQGGRAVLLEDVTAVEVAIEVEVILDRGVNGGEPLKLRNGISPGEARRRPSMAQEILL